jgi:hypothetical protein
MRVFQYATNEANCNKVLQRTICSLDSSTPGCLTTRWLLSAFGKRKRAAQEKYRAFVEQGENQPRPWEQLRNR